MSEPLSQDVKTKLLALARRSIEVWLKEHRNLQPGRDYERISKEPRGAFVTLKTEDGELRGCIGYILPLGPLDETVTKMAVAAATEDPRFHKVSGSELDGLKIEISALTVPEPVPSTEKIEIGTHGLIVTKGFHRGLLLPQVAPEWGWNREEFLEHTCLKAGLDREAWKDPDTKIEWFKAEVWGE